MDSAFDTLAYPFQKWVRNQGWSELRQIQRDAALYLSKSEGDLIISAATAGGKTEAAFLPLLSQVIEGTDQKSGFDLVYVGPLKALITDQAERLNEICKDTQLPVYPWHGDVSESVKKSAREKPGGVLLITPESLEALFVRRGNEIPGLFNATKAIIIDELHTMLDSERGIQLQSLLTRIEVSTTRRIRRIGLSATLGDMELARRCLRPDDFEQVKVITAKGGESALKVELRGYEKGDSDKETGASRGVAEHIFSELRGKDNLVFAGARSNVESYTDRLRSLCERKRLPQEFFPHHGNLTKQERQLVEDRLKSPNTPTTAVCTSTLELGIDIGHVDRIAQIGAPFSVASLRQRMGRSGRREGKPAILHQYTIETRLGAENDLADRLRIDFLRSLAIIELMLKGWCEPPRSGALHLSTLVHQILSIISERNGAFANRLYKTLCVLGPFRGVDQATFLEVLQSLGPSSANLLEQSRDGLLLLGAKAEKLVEHHSFYADFKTPEEFRLIAEGKAIGTLPIDYLVLAGMNLIFSGRRWLVTDVKDSEKVILLVPAKLGKAPNFGGNGGQIHDQVVQEMFDLLESKVMPIYLSKKAQIFLSEARQSYITSGLASKNIIEQGEKSWILATRKGTAKTMTLVMALLSEGYRVRVSDGILEVEAGPESANLTKLLQGWARGGPVKLFNNQRTNLKVEKYHPFLTRELLEQDALSSRLEPATLAETCSNLLGLRRR